MSCGESCQTCNVTSLGSPYCQCSYPFANVGDLVLDPSEDCFVVFPLSIAIHSFSGAIWIASFLLSLIAFLKTKRSVYKAWLKERYVTSLMTITSGFGSSWHMLEVAAQYPGQYSLGVSLPSTILWQCSMFSGTTFVFAILVIRSGTSVMPFAVQQSPRFVRRFFYPSMFAVFWFGQAVNTLVYAIYAWPTRAKMLVSLLYVSRLILPSHVGTNKE